MFSLAAVLHIKTSSKVRKQCLNTRRCSVLGWLILWEKRYRKEQLWKLHTVWHKLCGNGEGVAWCSISPNVRGHPLSQPLLSPWSRLGGRSRCRTPGGCYNQQPTTASLRNSPVGSWPSRSHGYSQFPGRKPSRAQVPMAGGDPPKQGCAAGCGMAGLEGESKAVQGPGFQS